MRVKATALEFDGLLCVRFLLAEAVCLAYRHLLFHTPHTLNLTLLAQAHAVLREVGDIHPLDEAPTVAVVAEKLFDSLKRAAEQPATPENATEKKGA